ncbi:MAG: MBL fold metallo-hydrolase [Sphingomonas sp.]
MTEAPTGVAAAIDPLVTRVLAGNPSPYTFTGTQTYLVGTADLAVIDPGPDEPAHLEALRAAIAGRPVTAIVCTHTHRDHSPAAAPLKGRDRRADHRLRGAVAERRRPARRRRVRPHLCARSRPRRRRDAVGRGVDARGGRDPPGHTSNHLCYALRETGALFSGDHVMGWSTTVVAPPDGDMADYMASLDKLLARDDRVYYPAHGPEIDRPRRFVRGLIGHRRQREGQILRLLGQDVREVPAMVARMYVGLDPRLIGAAGRSVLAHLIDLRARGLVTGDGDDWRMAA